MKFLRIGNCEEFRKAEKDLDCMIFTKWFNSLTVLFVVCIHHLLLAIYEAT